MAGRKTSQLEHREPLLTSRFDLFDSEQSDVSLKDFTSDVQMLAELIAEIVGGGSVEGVVFTEDFVVKQKSGRTFGKYVNGDTVPAANKTAKQVILLAAIDYLDPAFGSLSNAQLLTTFEVGEALPSGTLSIAYTITNFDNVKTQPPAVGVPSTNISGASFPTNPFTLVASGTFSIITPNDFRLSAPGTRTITLTGTNSNNSTFSVTGTVKWLYKQYYGPVEEAAASSEEVRDLPSNRFTDAGSVVVLNTGTTHHIFQVWLPTGQTLSNVTDLDALNANLTSQYVSSSLSVDDANGDPVAGTLYTMTQAVAYSVSHRHQLTIS